MTSFRTLSTTTGVSRKVNTGYLIDGSGADIHRNVLLTVKDGIITAIGPAADLPRNDGTATDDFSHCTLVPALVDCGVALSQSPSVAGTGKRLSSEKPGFECVADMFARHVG